MKRDGGRKSTKALQGGKANPDSKVNSELGKIKNILKDKGHTKCGGRQSPPPPPSSTALWLSVDAAGSQLTVGAKTTVFGAYLMVDLHSAGLGELRGRGAGR